MTEAEFMRLPSDGKYELVDGEPIKVPANFLHDVIGGNLAGLLRPYTRGRGFVANAQAGFRMRNGNIRCPDVSFTLKSRLPDGKPPAEFLDFAPDLAVEVISPSEGKEDMAQKVREYFESGAQQVWQLFPETQQLRLHHSAEESVLLESSDELDGGDLLPGFRCRVGELFELG
jgi:Uma2 family endonuclease